MKLNEIQDLIKFVAKSGVSEVELETKDVKIVIKTPAGKKEQVFVQTTSTVAQPMIQTAPAVQQVAAPVAETKAPEVKTGGGADESKYVTIKSPMIGTFYRSSSPDKPAFVSVGDEIAAGKAVCIELEYVSTPGPDEEQLLAEIGRFSSSVGLRFEARHILPAGAGADPAK